MYNEAGKVQMSTLRDCSEVVLRSSVKFPESLSKFGMLDFWFFGCGDPRGDSQYLSKLPTRAREIN